ncbi:MAG: PD-(D/E)XK nuclease family protein [Burkholderiales bacterium]
MDRVDIMQTDLAQAIKAGCVVLTPNRRLAAHLKREFDALQLTAGRTVWPTADILPYSAFLERVWQEFTRCTAADMLLSAQQELALWARIIGASPPAGVLFNLAGTARAAREAWAIQNAFCIDSLRHRALLNEDTAVYLSWASRYEEICRENNWLDSARLPDAIAALLRNAGNAKPRRLLLYAFDGLSPQQHRLLDIFRAAGWGISEANPVARPGTALCMGYADTENEFTAVAVRVKHALCADCTARIGVIVPDLVARRADVIRIFDDVLDAARITACSRERARSFNISLGRPLTDCPLVASAFVVLRLARGELPLETVGSLLRSPFFAGSEQELSRRALLDANLRTRGKAVVSPMELRHAAHGNGVGDPAAAPILAQRLDRWVGSAHGAAKLRQPPSAWGATFLQLLSGLGWPGERVLDSEEYQTFEKWRELISGFSGLDRVQPKLRYEEALQALAYVAADTLFQPESPEVGVQVLGALEANALEFDRLFVTGLSDEAWPQAPHPNPFLPISVQRALNVPHASAQWSLDFACRVTQNWLGAAAEVRLSYPLRDGDRQLKPSALLHSVPKETPAPSIVPLFRNTIFDARAIECILDFAAPPQAVGIRARGGATLFKDQAACPFRAFAVHRLGAIALESRRIGLDARERGLLVHHALALLWREIKNHAQLVKMEAKEQGTVIEHAVVCAISALRNKRPDVLTRAFANLEQQRITALIEELVELEKQRAPFHVIACEQRRVIRVAGVEIDARVDRIDRLADGCHAMFDYKTGKAVTGDWLGPRPNEPQLPLYAVSDPGEVCAVGFVQLRAGDVAFKGLARAEGVALGVEVLAGSRAAKDYGDWKTLMEGWRATLENIATDYLSGAAQVAPKQYPKTCSYCDLGTLCRVIELVDRGSVVEQWNNDE